MQRVDGIESTVGGLDNAIVDVSSDCKKQVQPDTSS